MTVSSRPPKKPLIIINGRAVHYMYAEITDHGEPVIFSNTNPRRTRPVSWSVTITRQPIRGMFVTETYSSAQLLYSIRHTDRKLYTLIDAIKV